MKGFRYKQCWDGKGVRMSGAYVNGKEEEDQAEKSPMIRLKKDHLKRHR
jgi:hypothetical protein